MRSNRVGSVVIALAALVGFAPQAGAQNGAPPSWKGGYRYAFDGGKTAGGSAIAVTCDLVIVPGAARGGCLLSVSGFQSDKRIVCHATGDARSVDVAFHGYEDGKIVNRYGVAVYKPGQTLLTLKRDENGELQTKWDGFRPDLPADAANPGRYFRLVEK
ncbi:DUF5991 domain-containing protein [Methylobacterium haplocladii]|uniref:Uncharacterized protein n=1 Tax=Methylobacterium haplocladii TaxID=1176176 RepID=A0A512IJ25_9HYPH|nr:DUF5991 domain-containing protein [Methylobacterium haplocladii]GEO97701.1 hypothetical protein MHA02_00890 [Methylobacterium haplocladii]GJD84424.1 hypothetical protein HPGCJGGD_2300 [Methylobacterium haplocladii]GLS57431.1 hypothetical protein GCM10007887_00860 [Methylobacterium haplocladii]